METKVAKMEAFILKENPRFNFESIGLYDNFSLEKWYSVLTNYIYHKYEHINFNNMFGITPEELRDAVG